MEYSGTTSPADETDTSAGALIAQAGRQASALVRDELRLAKTELAAKGRRLGTGAGLLAAAALAALLALQALVAAAIIGLAGALPAWLSALVVGAVLVLAAGTAALAGKRRIGDAAPLVPEETVRSVRDDLTEIKEEARR